jgi:CRP/FNR family cyclic AMP-dependent transcriptional regulator
MGRVVSFACTAVLMYEDEPADRVIVLLDGRVKVTRAGPDGQEQLVSIRGPGDILGELSMIDGAGVVGSAIALEPVRALVVGAAAFRRHLTATPAIALVLLEVLAHRLRDEVLKRGQCSASDSIARIAARLVELAERYGESSAHGTVIGLPLSQEELGAWAGASHAGVAKALQVLRELGWIVTERRRITVRDLDALRARAA